MWVNDVWKWEGRMDEGHWCGLMMFGSGKAEWTKGTGVG